MSAFKKLPNPAQQLPDLPGVFFFEDEDQQFTILDTTSNPMGVYKASGVENLKTLLEFLRNIFRARVINEIPTPEETKNRLVSLNQQLKALQAIKDLNKLLGK